MSRTSLKLYCSAPRRHPLPTANFAVTTISRHHVTCPPFTIPRPAGTHFLEYLLSRRSIAECLVFDEAMGGAKVLLFPRPTASVAARAALAAPPAGRGAAAGRPGAGYRVVEGPTCFIFHHVNAYEVGGKVVLDTVSWDKVRC